MSPISPLVYIQQNATSIEGGIFEGKIPLHLIQDENIPVDRSHAGSLSLSMQQEAGRDNSTGQLTPIALGHMSTPDTLVIIDGFHRVYALQQLGREAVNATIQLATTWEAVYDQRMAAAAPHKAVKFSRLAMWIEKVWEQGPWGEDQRLDALKGFGLELNPARQTPYGLSPKEVTDIRSWLREKGEIWKVGPSTLGRILTIARRADPALVASVRNPRDNDGSAITQTHLHAIVKSLPGEASYHLQHLVADVIQEHRFTPEQTAIVASSLSKNVPIKGAIEAVYEQFPSLRPTKQPSQQPAEHLTSPESRPANDTLANLLFEDEMEIAILTILNSIIRIRSHSQSDPSKYMLWQLLRAAHPIGATYLYNALNEGAFITATLPGTKADQDIRLQLGAAKTFSSRLTAEQARCSLPQLTKLQRRALTLSVFFNLPDANIARLLDQETEATEEYVRIARETMDSHRSSAQLHT